MRGFDPPQVHSLSGGFHTGVLDDSQIPAAITRDAEWQAIPFWVSASQAVLSAERLLHTARLAADVVYNNTTTLSNVLSISLRANGRYVITALITFDSDAAADIKFAFVLPPGASSALPATVAYEGITGADIITMVQDVTLALAAGGDGVGVRKTVLITFELFSGDGGNLTLQAAQSTLTALDTTVRADSAITALETAP